ncbi:MAG: bacillithiol biosynthesis BshC [Acidobacteriota bacterium]
MSGPIIPFERYPGISPLFARFLAGLPEFYPDPPTIEAAAERGRRILGRPSRVPAGAFRFRGEAAKARAEDLAAGRAVAVVAGHQVGLFTGPLFTITKAFDAIRVAREISDRGVPAVPVFWALTDDHDLEEVARTARPGKDGPEVIVLEGADRSNRAPVGRRAIPEGVRPILDAFAADARAPGSEELVETLRRRYSPGTTYGEAFIESLLDLAPEGLLVLDPYQESLREATAAFFQEAVRREAALREALAGVSGRLEAAELPVPVAFRAEVFPFFTIEKGERRRVDSVADAAARIASGESWVSSDVLTRPVLKSWLMPNAASVLGPAEIAYHAQSLPLFRVFDLEPPVLLPRSFVIPIGPPERRAMEALGITRENLLVPPPERGPVEVPGAAILDGAATDADKALDTLEPDIRALDPTLVGALENTKKKVAYQLEQLKERMKKAVDRKNEVANSRRRRLDSMLLPQGAPAERLYPPLVPLLAYGPAALESIREAASGSLEGATLAELGTEGTGTDHAEGTEGAADRSSDGR